MGMSSHVVGFRQPDDKYLSMKAVYDACRAADVDLPNEVECYFDNNSPDGYGSEVELVRTSGAVRLYNDGSSRSGFDVELGKLPEGVTHIRFYNSW